MTQSCFCFFYFEYNPLSFLKQNERNGKYLVSQDKSHDKFIKSFQQVSKRCSKYVIIIYLSTIRWSSGSNALEYKLLILKPDQNFESMLSKLFEKCPEVTFPNVLEIISKMLIGLQFFLTSPESILNTGVTLANLEEAGYSHEPIHCMKSVRKLL